MKQYKFTLTIDEGNDEFWEELRLQGKSGCDQLTNVLRVALLEYGFDEDNSNLELVKFQKVHDTVYISE